MGSTDLQSAAHLKFPTEWSRDVVRWRINMTVRRLIRQPAWTAHTSIGMNHCVLMESTSHRVPDHE